MNFVTDGNRAVYWIFGLVVVVPVAVMIAVMLVRSGPSSLRVSAFLPTLSILLVVAAMLLVAVKYGQAVAREGENLFLRGAFVYSAQVPVSSVRLKQVKPISETVVRVVVRTNGVGLPGYQVGWFNLSNGRKAFVVKTSANALYIPTDHDFDLILSMKPSHLRELLDGPQ